MRAESLPFLVLYPQDMKYSHETTMDEGVHLELSIAFEVENSAFFSPNL